MTTTYSTMSADEFRAGAYVHVDTIATCRDDGYEPAPSEPDPTYMARLDELLALRVGHLPCLGGVGDWRLQLQHVPEDGLEAEYTDTHILPVPAGVYLGLMRGSTCWMADNPPELWTMRGGIDALKAPSTRRVLVTGLGLGVIVQHALRQPHVERVDVIERDPDVFRLVRPHYRGHGKRLVVHRGDAYTLPLRGAWDLAYHDIWPARSFANIADYVRLGRRWREQVARQLFWPEETLAEQAAHRGGEEASLWQSFLELREHEGW